MIQCEDVKSTDFQAQTKNALKMAVHENRSKVPGYAFWSFLESILVGIRSVKVTCENERMKAIPLAKVPIIDQFYSLNAINHSK